MPQERSRTVAPRDHLLDVAGSLFYKEGINAVGIDRIVQEAGVTRATLYRHFGGKEGLIVGYLQNEDQGLRTAFEQAELAAVSPVHLLQLAIEGIAEDATKYHLRGCPFINAAAEFSSPESAVRKTVSAHRVWFRGILERYLAEAGREPAGELADTLVMLRDAVLVGSYLDDPETARVTFLRAARTLVRLDPA